MGWFRKMGRSSKKGSRGLGLHRSEQLDVEAGIGGVQLPIGQPSTGHGATGISLLAFPTALLKGPPGGRWNSHVFPS